MSFLELVKKRASCRKYQPKAISREIITRCLDAARLAPSACNSQPWHFIVVDTPQLKDELVSKALSGIHSTNSFVKDAGAIVVVITEKSKYLAKLAGYCKGTQFSLIDLGIACEHFILQAQEEGLGTCWIGWFDEAKVKKVLNIPKAKSIDVIISVGYPAQGAVHEKKRCSLEEISEFL